MAELPSHHDTGAPGSPRHDPPITGMSRTRKVLLITVVIALATLAVVLHATGVIGGEGH